MSNTEELVTLSKSEYDSLVEDSDWLRCLEAAGVDNWDGYDYALEIRSESND